MKKIGKNPLSSRPFWRKINKFRTKKLTRQIPSLLKDGKEYNSDNDKGKIFGDLLATTISPHLDFVESDDNCEVSQTIRDMSMELGQVPKSCKTKNISKSFNTYIKTY
ncbi:hypothetical protein BpHYR1_008965 [Brachionus plicatilis]|uniref:Uncharacterized protein n=1 Tax=Brachionus plicatilis TaxID=10195 RepID=A0A3M7Q2E8_BRAPC|nr:hypothetical protein BpHYR1_008965 [Brachionus plicatilis]